jgi:hypothetical protein
MDRPVTGERGRARTLWRGGFVLLAVLGLHAVAVYGIRRELALGGPVESTQTTMIAALLSPPPPPVLTAPRTVRPEAPAPTHAPAALVPAASPVAESPEPAPAPPEPPPDPVAEAPAEPPVPATELSEMQANAAKVPLHGRIAYRGRGTNFGGIEVLVFVDWSIDRDKQKYEIWLRSVDPPGLFEVRSSGDLKPFGIAPIRYVERLEVINREWSVDFDWSTHIAHFSGPRAGSPGPFTEGTQDFLSAQFQLPLLAQTYPWRFVPGAELQFQIARRQVETYSARVVGWEVVQVQGKDIKTLKIERRRGPGVRREVDLWLAPEFDWLAVKVRLVNANDDVWESELAHLPGVGPPPEEPVRQERITP